MLFGVKAPRKYGPAEMGDIVVDFRSPVEILAHIFFLAKHGTPIAIAVAPRIAVAALAAIREAGVR